MRSSTWLNAAALLFVTTIATRAADLKVYSEFRRIGPDSQIVKADEGGRVREILSPLAVRGGYTTFRIVVEAPAGSEFWVYIGQNPDDNARATLYRELPPTTPGAPPDALEKVDIPYQGKVPAGSAAVTFLLDLYYERTASVERVKIEPQLHYDNRWIIYPMEVRIAHAALSAADASRIGAHPPYPPTDPTLRAETPAFAALRDHLCGAPAKPATPLTTLTARALLYRNALQDLALATYLQEAKRNTLLPDAKTHCAASVELPFEGWLRIRESIYKALAPAE